MGNHTSDRETLSPKMQDMAYRLGRRMAELREALGLTQEAVGARAGLSSSYVSMLERGARLPHLEALDALARVLGSDMLTLLGEEEAEELESAKKVQAFLHTHALTGAEVDRLLGVARLMFPHRPGDKS